MENKNAYEKPITLKNKWMGGLCSSNKGTRISNNTEIKKRFQ